MNMPTWVYVAVITGNFPVYYGAYRLLFRELDEFFQAIYFWFKPDMWSFIDGEFFDDFWAELKLGIFFAICGGCVYLELTAINTHFYLVD